MQVNVRLFWLLIVLPLCFWACSNEETEGERKVSASTEVESVAVLEAGDALLVRNVTLIDGTGNKAQANMDIRIADGRIVEIGAGLSPAAGTEIIDGSGKFVIPGIIDAHAHLDAAVVFQLTADEKAQIIEHNPRSFLYNGVTTVLNVSSVTDWILNNAGPNAKADYSHQGYMPWVVH